LEKLLKHASSQMANTFYEMANAAENCIAQTYLNFELDKLVTFNKIRMESINRLSNTTTLHLYEAHLLWLDQLICALRTIDSDKMPELHPQKCTVGKWLTSNAHEVITDKTVLDEFVALHKNLHFIGKKIQLNFSHKPIDFHILMLLLKKVETLSLSIGVELSIISNVRFQASASKDPLTGALNRQLLFHIFSTQFEVSRAVEKKFSLIIADLDDFKFINDTYGHVEGDRVLKSFAAMLIHILRDSDFVIRFGGEEFLLILPTTELDDAMKLAEKSKDATHLLHTQDKLVKSISASFGVLEISHDTETEVDEALMAKYIDKVDQALYFAKKNGKDQVSCLSSTDLK
jgi:diguanylate cyclase (GGDEF)-like protein